MHKLVHVMWVFLMKVFVGFNWNAPKGPFRVCPEKVPPSHAAACDLLRVRRHPGAHSALPSASPSPPRIPRSGVFCNSSFDHGTVAPEGRRIVLYTVYAVYCIRCILYSETVYDRADTLYTLQARGTGNVRCIGRLRAVFAV